MERKTFGALIAILLLIFPAGLFAENSTVPNCSGYTSITVGGAPLTSGTYSVSLTDVSVADEAHPAIMGGSFGQISIAPFSSQTFNANNGDIVTVSVCSTTPGFTASAKSAYVKMTVVAPSNQPPVIKGLSGPTSVLAGQANSWTVDAYDPDSSQMLTVLINWGDSQNMGAGTNLPATFEHTYYLPGTYAITFSVQDSFGAESAKSMYNVTVRSAQNPCTDSDGGQSLFVKGTGKGDYIGAAAGHPVIIGDPANGIYQIVPSPYDYSIYYDHCYSESQINEAFCDQNGKLSSVATNCPSGYICSDGACKSQAAPTVDLKVNGADNPSAVLFNSTFTVSWTSNAEYCVPYGYHILLPDGRLWTGLGNQAASGSVTLLAAHQMGYMSPLQVSMQCYIGSKSASDTVYVPVTQTTSTNQPPVISNVGGSTSLSVNEKGKWTVSAYDPEGSAVYYSVNWGEGEYATLDTASKTGSSATFEHAYAKAGTYTITFTVKDAQGATAQSANNIVYVQSPAQNLPDYIITSISLSGNQTTYNGQNALSIQENARMPVSAVVKNIGGNAQGASNVIFIFFSSSTPASVPPLAAGQSMNVDSFMFCTSADGESTVSANVNQDYAIVESNYANNRLLAAPMVICNHTGANLPPVISDLSGSASLKVNEKGKWKVSAYDPDGRLGSNSLTFGVSWGDSDRSATDIPSTSQAGVATFEHAYSRAGTYTITFTVADEKGASATKSTKVTVSEAAASEVYASVGAIPTELYQYDSVYVTGKVSRTGTINDLSAKTYLVVLSFDNGNAVSQSTDDATTQSADQAKKEEITIGPGETRSISAYFVASKLGTNFAKLSVYEKMDVCIARANSGASERNSACKGTYQLVASDSMKVYVKQSGIPSPPSEKITLKLVPGWNQISVPTEYDVQLSDMQKKCSITSAWQYSPASGQYSAATTFGKGKMGFWVKASSACEYELDEPYISTWSASLKAGWNMIGAPASAAKLSDVAGNCKITSGAWHYSQVATSGQATNGEYVYASKLEPGNGYWVKVASDCTMSMDDSPPSVPSG